MKLAVTLAGALSGMVMMMAPGVSNAAAEGHKVYYTGNIVFPGEGPVNIYNNGVCFDAAAQLYRVNLPASTKKVCTKPGFDRTDSQNPKPICNGPVVDVTTPARSLTARTTYTVQGCRTEDRNYTDSQNSTCDNPKPIAVPQRTFYTKNVCPWTHPECWDPVISNTDVPSC